MAETEWRVIVSRKSGGGKALTDWPHIAQLLNEKGVRFSEKITEYSYHAIELAAESYRDGFRKFLVVGGDGAVHEVLNGLFSMEDADLTEVTLALIPVGSGNDWARLHNIPTDYSEAVDLISRSEVKTCIQDVAKVSTMMDGKPYSRYMVNIGGLGFDSLVCQKYDIAKANGKASDRGYYKALLSSFFTYKCLKFKVVADGELFYTGRVLSLALGIGKYCGGGMMQTPGAVFDDGLVDVTVIKKISKLRFVLSLPKLYKGTIYDLEGKVLHTRAKHLYIKAWPYSYMEVDGEPVGRTPVTIEVIPHAVKVVSNIK